MVLRGTFPGVMPSVDPLNHLITAGSNYEINQHSIDTSRALEVRQDGRT